MPIRILQNGPDPILVFVSLSSTSFLSTPIYPGVELRLKNILGLSRKFCSALEALQEEQLKLQTDLHPNAYPENIIYMIFNRDKWPLPQLEKEATSTTLLKIFSDKNKIAPTSTKNNTQIFRPVRYILPKLILDVMKRHLRV